MMDDNNRWDKDFPEQWERVPLENRFNRTGRKCD